MRVWVEYSFTQRIEKYVFELRPFLVVIKVFAQDVVDIQMISSDNEVQGRKPRSLDLESAPTLFENVEEELQNPACIADNPW